MNNEHESKRKINLKEMNNKQNEDDRSKLYQRRSKEELRNQIGEGALPQSEDNVAARLKKE